MMAGTRIPECLTEASRAPVAFGRLAIPRLMTALQSEEREIRQAGLYSLCNLLHEPERAHEALRHGTDVTPVLLSDWSKSCD